MADEDTTTQAPADTEATSSTADAGDKAGSEDYLRAQIKALAKQRDEFKALAREAEKTAKAASSAEAKRQAEAGDWEAVAKRYEAELAEVKPRLDVLAQLEERENARLDSVREEVAKLSGKLPKALRESIPDGIDPDAGLRMVRALHDTILTKAPAAEPAATPASAPKRDVFSARPEDIPGIMREMPSAERRSLIGRLLTQGR